MEATAFDRRGALLVLGNLPADAITWPDALEEFAWALEARDDQHASAEYRRQLVRRLGLATLQEAAACRA